ncbi:peptide synthase [compost metagenome]
MAGTPRGQGIGNLRVDDQALAQNRAQMGEGSAIMSCGISQPDHGVLIIDPASLG